MPTFFELGTARALPLPACEIISSGLNVDLNILCASLSEVVTLIRRNVLSVVGGECLRQGML